MKNQNPPKNANLAIFDSGGNSPGEVSLVVTIQNCTFCELFDVTVLDPALLWNGCECVSVRGASTTPAPRREANWPLGCLRNICGKRIEVKDEAGNLLLQGTGHFKPVGYHFDFSDCAQASSPATSKQYMFDEQSTRR